jgi:uncharacterized lipoprotein YajG
MQFRYMISALVSAVVLASCATQPPVQTNATDIVCDKEAPTNPTAQISTCNQREE